MFRIVEEPIDVAGIVAALQRPDAGAVAVFIGTVRRENDGRGVLWLEYEAYPAMAERAMASIGEEIVTRFGPGLRVAMVHRIGRLEVGETSVVVAVASPHRTQALEACRHGIERLKEIVPIWKKEVFEGGEEWLDNRS